MPSDGQGNEFSVQSEVNKDEERINLDDCEIVEESGSADDPNRSSENSNKVCGSSSNAEVRNAPKKKKICELNNSVDLTGNQPDNASNLFYESNNIIMQIKEEIEDTANSHCEEMEGTSSSIFIRPNTETVLIKEEPREDSIEFVEPDDMIEIKQEVEEDPFIEPENVMVKIEEGMGDPLNTLCGPDDATSIKEEAEDVIEPEEDVPEVVSDSDDVTELIKEEVDLQFSCDHDYEGRSRKSDGYVKVYTECTLKAMAFIANEQAAKAAELKESVEPKKAKMNDLLVNLEGELSSTEYIKVYPDEYLRGIKPHLKFAKGSSSDPRPRVSDDIKLSILEEAKANFTRVEGPEVQIAKSQSRSTKGCDVDPSPGVSSMKSTISNLEETTAIFSRGEILESRVAKSHSKSILEEAKANFTPEPRGVMPLSKFLKESHVNMKPKVSDEVKLSILEEAKANFTREAPEARDVKFQSKSVKGSSTDSKSKVSDNVKLRIIEEARINFSRVDTPESQEVKPHSKFVKGNNVDPRSRFSDDVKLSILEEARANFSRVEAPEASKTQNTDGPFLAIKSEIGKQVWSLLDEAKDELFPVVASTSFQQPNATIGPSKINAERKRGRPRGSGQKQLLQKVVSSPYGHGKVTLPPSVSTIRKRPLGFGLYVEQPVGLAKKKKVQSLEEVVENMQIERKIAREQLAILDKELKKQPVLSSKTRKARGLGDEPNQKLSKTEIQVRVKKNAAQVIEDAEERYRIEQEIAKKQLASLDKDTTPTKPLPFSPSTPKARLGFGSLQEHLKPIIIHKVEVKKKRVSVNQQLKETVERMDMERQLAEKQLASLSNGIMATAPAFSPLTPKARLKMGYVTLKPPLQPRIPTLGQINRPFRPICPPPAGGSRS